MDKRKSIKTAAAVLTAVALCVSSVAAYQRLGNTYVPSGQKRDLQTNQVLFPEDKDTQNSDSGTQEDESAYWGKRPELRCAGSSAEFAACRLSF